ncbi:MAG: sulfurtransferase [bacterium]|nr:MAG: sulfurtransferase [bacterium]
MTGGGGVAARDGSRRWRKNVSRALFLPASVALLVLGSALLAPVASGARQYEEPSYMVEAPWLAANLGREDLVILDARGEKAHRKGHIPGAVAVRWQEFAVTTGRPGSPKWGVAYNPGELASRFALAGVDGDKTVVVYADPVRGWGEDGRFVWMLRMLGVKSSMFLNGGYPCWVSSGYPVSREAVKPRPTGFAVKEGAAGFSVDTSWMRENLGRAHIIDTRTREEFLGARRHGEARGGHIPGAVSIPHTSLLGAQGRLKPQEELEEIFSEAGIGK